MAFDRCLTLRTDHGKSKATLWAKYLHDARTACRRGTRPSKLHVVLRNPLKSSRSDSALHEVGTVAGMVVGVVLAFAVVFIVIRHCARKQDNKFKREKFPKQSQIVTLRINPLHESVNGQLDYEEPVTLNSDYIETTGGVAGNAQVALDTDRYVAPAHLSRTSNVYRRWNHGNNRMILESATFGTCCNGVNLPRHLMNFIINWEWQDCVDSRKNEYAIIVRACRHYSKS